MTYLLSPMSSMAFQGGPINTNPASVHFRAKAEFSLSFSNSFISFQHQFVCMDPTHKAITGMYPLATLSLCDFNNAVSVEVGRDGP